MSQLSDIERAQAAGETSADSSKRLRGQSVNADTVAALLTQVDLRRKAKGKFAALATHMLFTPAGLEQASRYIVSQHHARRFAEAGCRLVADLGCGIGTESLALREAGIETLSVELDPFTAQIAEHNIRALNAGTLPVRVITADATMVSLGEVDGAFFDPARRTSGHSNTRRLSSVDDYSPPLNFAFDVASRLPTGIKLGPSFDRDLIPEEAEAQWVSVNGQVVEMGLWFGSLSRPGVRRAALVLHGDRADELVAEADSPDAPLRALGSYLYEPDGSVIRARLIGQLADDLHSGMISDGIAYLSSDRLTPTPFAQAFRVIELLPASEKHLKRELATRGIGQLEIKKRGANVDPAALRTRLRLKGPNAATLFLTRVGGKHVALLAERV